jgi:hypothetical protein
MGSREGRGADLVPGGGVGEERGGDGEGEEEEGEGAPRHRIGRANGDPAARGEGEEGGGASGSRPRDLGRGRGSPRAAARVENKQTGPCGAGVDRPLTEPLAVSPTRRADLPTHPPPSRPPAGVV